MNITTKAIGRTTAARNRKTLALAIVAALCAAGALTADAAVGSAVPVARPTRLQAGDAVIGALPMNQPIHIEVALKLRNKDVLDAFIANNARNQASGESPQLMTSEQFLANHAPTQAQARKVADYLTAMGYTNVSIAPNCLLVSADGTAATARNAFMTTFAQVRTVDGRIGYANTDAVRIPAALGDTVLAVLGLQDVHVAHTFAERAANVHPEAGTQGHSPVEFPFTYGLVASLEDHIHVGIISDGDLKPTLTDLDAFVAANNVVNLTREVRTVHALSSVTAHTSTWDLISQTVAGMAMKNPKLIFYNGPGLTNANLAADYNDAVVLDLAKTVVAAVGECETDANNDGAAAADDAIFEAAIAHGISFVVAAGDRGADECRDGSLAPSWPAASQYVIAVGGTHLFGGIGTWSSERVWANTGGSPSLFEPMPSWQTALGVPGTTRGVPDLSFDGDPSSGALVYVNLALTEMGGTALSAAIFASAWAELNYQKTGGFPGPVIYGLPAADFHDITVGDNNGETAGPGYDFASGRGSLNLEGFFADGEGLLNKRPVADFSIAETAPDRAQFTDHSTDDGTIVAHRWSFGDGGVSSATNPSHSYAADGVYQVTETVTDNYDVTGSTTQNFIVGPAQFIGNPSFETGSLSPWHAGRGNLLDSSPVDAFDGTYSTVITRNRGEDYFLYQFVPLLPAYKSSASLVFHLWVQDPGVPSGTTDTLTVDILAKPGGTVLETLATFANADVSAGYATHTYDMSAFRGQKVVLSFRVSNPLGRERSHLNFHIDDVTLTVPP